MPFQTFDSDLNLEVKGKERVPSRQKLILTITTALTQLRPTMREPKAGRLETLAGPCNPRGTEMELILFYQTCAQGSSSPRDKGLPISYLLHLALNPASLKQPPTVSKSSAPTPIPQSALLGPNTCAPTAHLFNQHAGNEVELSGE